MVGLNCSLRNQWTSVRFRVPPPFQLVVPIWNVSLGTGFSTMGPENVATPLILGWQSLSVRYICKSLSVKFNDMWSIIRQVNIQFGEDIQVTALKRRIGNFCVSECPGHVCRERMSAYSLRYIHLNNQCVLMSTAACRLTAAAGPLEIKKLPCHVKEWARVARVQILTIHITGVRLNRTQFRGYVEDWARVAWIQIS